MSVSNFHVNERIFIAEWEHDGVRSFVGDVKQACLDSARNFIAVLENDHPKESLKIFDESGSMVLTFSPPPGYLFEYLLTDASHGVRVICSAPSERGDILDWYFKIDPLAKELVKQGRAY